MVGTAQEPLPTLRSADRLPRQADQFQQHRFAGIDQFFQRDARATFVPRCAAAGERRDVYE